MAISRISAWSMWFIVSIFYAYQYILRVIPNIMVNDIIEQYHINAAIFGQFSGVYYIGYSLMHIPLGIMLDRFGPKKIVPLCMILTSFGLLPILFTNIWIYPIVGRFFTGVGSSAAILGAFKIIRFAFPEKDFTRILSFCVTIGLMGAIYGGGPVSYLNAILGYKMVTALLIMVGLVLAIATYFITPNIITTETSSIASSLKEVFLSYKVIAVCLLSGLLVGPLEGFADVWGVTFLKLVYGFSEYISASLPSLIFVGMAVGGFILSTVAEKTHSYLGTIAMAGFVMAISFLCLCFKVIPANTFSMGILFFIVGICCAYQIIAIYKASKYVNKNVVGLTTAVANMIIMTFGYIFHATIGCVVKNSGGISNPQALINGVALIPIALLIGSFGFIAIAIHDRIGQD